MMAQAVFSIGWPLSHLFLLRQLLAVSVSLYPTLAFFPSPPLAAPSSGMFAQRAHNAIPSIFFTMHAIHDNDCDLLLEHTVQEKLDRIAFGYKMHMDSMLRTLATDIEFSTKIEKCLLKQSSQLLLMSERYRRKQSIMEECLNANYQVVQQLLLGDAHAEGGTRGTRMNRFQNIQFSIPSRAGLSSDNDLSTMLGNGGMANNNKGVGGGERSSTTMKETEGYDTAKQVIHHTARDWTLGSTPCRDATNGWIVNAISENASTNAQHHLDRSVLRVLVPGAGLGRLAYDISTSVKLWGVAAIDDVQVEANDSSITMAFAAQSVLDMLKKNTQSRIYPFVSDPQTNEIDSTKRFEGEVFPDEIAIESFQHCNVLKGELNTLPNLSFTVGDFVSTYSQNAKQGMYDVVATSFFIDTATNIYEYVMIMKHLLHSSESSIWVNVGPVQWHPCALLHPTVDELKDIMEVSGFELITWEIAKGAVAYRHPDDGGQDDGFSSGARYTRSEAYRPLRFVARLKVDHVGVEEVDDDLPLRIEYCEYLNEVANGGTGGSAGT